MTSSWVRRVRCETPAPSPIDARKTSFGRAAALALAAQVDELYSCRGKRVVHVDLKSARPSDDELCALLLGPSGNLRAPALRLGRTLIIGYDPATYAAELGRS